MVVAEIKYSVCPHPFRRPREARWVRDLYGTGVGQVRDRERGGKGTDKGGVI